MGGASGLPRRFQRERGAALVEMALVLPLLVLIMVGIVTTARAWNIHNILDHAAREAARYGATDPTPTTIMTTAQGVVLSASYPWSAVSDRCVNVIDDGTVTSLGSNPCIPPGSGEGQDPTTDDRVQVSLTIPDYELNFIFFQIDVDLTARAVARLEP